MRWILDTNVWIEAVAGVPHAANAVLKAAIIEQAILVTRNVTDFKKVTELNILDPVTL